MTKENIYINLGRIINIGFGITTTGGGAGITNGGKGTLIPMFTLTCA